MKNIVQKEEYVDYVRMCIHRATMTCMCVQSMSELSSIVLNNLLSTYALRMS